jgi:predicted PurR-regulated permease PerM
MEKIKITNSSIIFTILFAATLYVAYQAKLVIIVSFIGIGFGVLVLPILDIIHSRFHIPRALAVFLVFVGIILFFALVGGSIYYIAADQINELSSRWPEIETSIKDWVANLLDENPWVKDKMAQFDAGMYARNSLTKIFKGFQAGVVAMSSFVFAFIIGFYTALSGKDYYQSLVKAFPERHRKKASKLLIDCADVLRNWFRAQLIDMVIIGVVTGLGLWIVGVQYWAVFGLLTAVFGIIPYVGIIIVVIAASFITIGSDPSKIPWVFLVFFISQQLEGNVILPMVLKGKANLPVVPLLIFMLFMGTFFGLLGVFIAPPTFAIIRTLYIEIYLPMMEKDRWGFV